MEYVLHIVILLGIYTTLAASLNLVAGHTGLVSLCHAAFYGLGAYAGGLLALKLGSPFLVNVLSSAAICAIIAVLVGVPSLRIHDDLFTVATLALQLIAFSVMNNWVSLTGGPMGLVGIPTPRIGGWQISSRCEFVLLTTCLAGVATGVNYLVRAAPLGRVLRAIREDEVLTASKGKNVAAIKVCVFAVSGSLAGVAGATYACYAGFIDPTMFTEMESIFILSIVIVGGAGSTWGPTVGALCLVAGPEALRFLGLPDAWAAPLRQVLFGIALLLTVLFRPRGIVGRTHFVFA